MTTCSPPVKIIANKVAQQLLSSPDGVDIYLREPIEGRLRECRFGGLAWLCCQHSEAYS